MGNGNCLALPEAALPESAPLCPGIKVASAQGWALPAIVLAAIVLAGAAARLLLWLSFQGQPLAVWDERDYNTLAVNLVRHGEFAYSPGRPASLRPPLYPAALAGVYELFGLENFQAVRLLQACLSLVTVVLLYRLGAGLFSPRVGLWLGGVYAFYPSLLGANNLLLTEVLFTFLLCSACYTLVRALQRDSLALLPLAGVFFGLGALTRSVLWLFVPVLALYLLLAWRGSARRRLAALVLLVVPYAGTIAPWSIRTSRLEKTFVAVDTMGGRNFMMGNYEYTPLYRSWDAVSLEGEKAWDRVLAAQNPSLPGTTQGERDKLALRSGIRFVLENPGLTLQRDVVKFFQFWGLERELVAGAARGYFGETSRPVLLLLTVVIFGSYTCLLLLGVFGMVLAPPGNRRAHALILLVIVYVCGMHTMTFGHSRYHLPLMPLVFLYSASALLHRRAIWRRRRRWPFWLAVSICGMFLGSWLWEIGVVDGARYTDLFCSL
jgi:4-amino-4-deoxy-L-arabinose transferase-like glycosyltransferase